MRGNSHLEIDAIRSIYKPRFNSSVYHGSRLLTESIAITDDLAEDLTVKLRFYGKCSLTVGPTNSLISY